MPISQFTTGESATVTEAPDLIARFDPVFEAAEKLYNLSSLDAKDVDWPTWDRSKKLIADGFS